ncbi:MAG: aspartate 1-decarboxylase [Ginsengibacter sp.]|jgi:aspartate 1-decarboxylase
MLLQLLRVKIQQLVVTESSENYPGSIALPDELIEAAGLKLFEQVHVNNINNGNRIITYVIRSKREGFVSVNGAASRKFNKGDRIHVLAFGFFDKEKEAEDFQPTIVHADENNKLKDVKKYTF